MAKADRRAQPRQRCRSDRACGDSNGWKCLLAAAKAPEKTIWTLAEPPEEVTGYRPPHYALAVADSAVYGGQWVAAFDKETRKALASGVPDEYWNAVTGAIRFFGERKHWLEQSAPARLGIVSDFSGPNQFLSDEALNLMMRRHLAYRIIDRARLKTESLRDLKAVLWIDQRGPESSAKSTLSTFTENGGLLILPASAASLTSGRPAGNFESRFDYYPTGKGKVALATKPWSHPGFWLPTHTCCSAASTISSAHSTPAPATFDIHEGRTAVSSM